MGDGNAPRGGSQSGVNASGAARVLHALDESPGIPHTLRAPCATCGTTNGHAKKVGPSNVVRCLNGHFAYNAPKSETGEAPSARKRREGLSSDRRQWILERDGFRCCTCGRAAGPDRTGFVVELEIGHLLSVAEGKALGATQEELDDDENLVTQCQECNAAQGARSFPLRTAVRLIQAARLRRTR